LPVSGVVIARDEADRIERCVRSLTAVCDEVLVLDSGSTDATVAVARAAGGRVETQSWLGFSAQKNEAIARSRQPWVLLLDADEWLTPQAQQRIRALFAVHEGGTSAVETADVWRLQRRTHFLGAPLRFGGWGREVVERLFRRDLRYLQADVHERLDLAGRRVATVRARIEHDTARSLPEYADKLSGYAMLWARQNAARGKRAGRMDAGLHATAYWLKNYVLRGGFLDGAGGWRYHACHARYVAEKYARLRRLSASDAA
jgi:(heptosyl)LPS beta-1,4-glucosyltransferase